MSTNKKQQHYVWRYYLKPWTESDLVWCRRDNKIYNPNIMGVAQERYFYKLKSLSSPDVDFLKRIIEISQPSLKKVNENWINGFKLISDIEKIYSGKENVDEYATKEIDVVINNLEENLHAGIEEIGKKYLNLIYNQSTDFFSTENGRQEFAFFICSQYMRTKNLQSRFISEFGYSEGIDSGAVWSVLRHILSTNISLTISSDKGFKIRLLENETKTPFITGDQPVINTFFNRNDDNLSQGLEFYCPIGPNVAILVYRESFSLFNGRKSLGLKDVENYNLLIKESSHDQIFGLTRECIE